MHRDVQFNITKTINNKIDITNKSKYIPSMEYISPVNKKNQKG